MKEGWEERGPKALSKTLMLVPLRFRYSEVLFQLESYDMF